MNLYMVNNARTETTHWVVASSVQSVAIILWRADVISAWASWDVDELIGEYDIIKTDKTTMSYRMERERLGPAVCALLDDAMSTPPIPSIVHTEPYRR